MPGIRETGNGIPCVDLNNTDRKNLSETIVEACQQFGFFKVVSHGVPKQAVSRLEEKSTHFFQKPPTEKHRAGPPNPFGYGCNNIGQHGDTGELEYLLMEANRAAVTHRCAALSPDRAQHLSATVNDYVGAVRSLACRLLDLAEEGLSGSIASLRHFSRLIAHPNNDSFFRINRYHADEEDGPNLCRVGFGEYSDPQIVTILRSNEVAGLEIWSRSEGVWIPVIPEPPDQMFVFVGDAFEALTNGRFRSVRHRVLLVNSGKPRISIVYFGAPPLDAWIRPHPNLIPADDSDRLYKDFTWGDFKTAVYASRLADHRLHLFANN